MKTKLNPFFLKFVPFVVLALALIGCSQGFVPFQKNKLNDRLNSNLQIWGGEKVNTQDPLAGTAVAIIKSNGFPFCTGVYLGGQVVATAAHCLTELQTPLAYVSFDLETPTEWDPAYGNLGPNSPNARKIRSFVTHENFDSGRFTKANLSKEPTSPLFDVGLLLFEGSAPAGAKPASIEGPDRAIGPETELILAGYGRSDASGGDYGRLYKVKTKVGQVRLRSLEIVDGPNSEKGSCVGDSGGPVMAKSNPTNLKSSNSTSEDGPGFALTGLVSYGPSDCGIGKGFNTDLRYFKGWLEKGQKCLELTKYDPLDATTFKNKCGAGFASLKDLVPVSKGSFYDNCLNRNQSLSFSHTMNVLLNKLGTQDCYQAAKLSTQIKDLDLSHEDIEDISPLEHFVSLEVLNLSYNRIVEAKPLASLQNLKTIRLFESGLDDAKVNAFMGAYTHLSQSSPSRYFKLPVPFCTSSLNRASFSQRIWLSAIEPNLRVIEGLERNSIPVLKTSSESDGLRILDWAQGR